jgi:hypothetical protein
MAGLLATWWDWGLWILSQPVVLILMLLCAGVGFFLAFVLCDRWSRPEGE